MGKRSYVLADGSRGFDEPVEGKEPTSGTHLSTKDYVDSAVGAGTGSAYEHNQTPAATTWNITHNLGFRPGGILVLDTSGNTIWGEVAYPDINTVTITFQSAREGTAYLT